MGDLGSSEDLAMQELATSDRRQGERFRSVWRIAKVKRLNDLGLWRVRNISENGMMLATQVSANIGEHLEVALSDAICMSGQIRWIKAGNCGISFDQPINVREVLKSLAKEQQEVGYRQPRLPFQHKAEIIIDGQSDEIELVNLSQTGVGFKFDGGLSVGKPLGLIMIDKVRRTAIVRWKRGGKGGLWLTEPLKQTDLESIRLFEARAMGIE